MLFSRLVAALRATGIMVIRVRLYGVMGLTWPYVAVWRWVIFFSTFLFRIFLRPEIATENDACRCNTSTEE